MMGLSRFGSCNFVIIKISFVGFIKGVFSAAQVSRSIRIKNGIASSHGRGCSCRIARNIPVGDWVPHVCEELPVDEVISRVHHICWTKRHRRLVGLRERMPSKSCLWYRARY